MSCRVWKNGEALDTCYEANGKAYRFGNDQEYATLNDAMRDILYPRPDQQPELMLANTERRKEWQTETPKRKTKRSRNG
jgi:hypothetical protein